MREVGFGITVMPQGAFYVFADASRWTDDSYAFAFELLEKAGVGVAPGVDFGQSGGEVQLRLKRGGKYQGGGTEDGGVVGEEAGLIRAVIVHTDPRGGPPPRDSLALRPRPCS